MNRHDARVQFQNQFVAHARVVLPMLAVQEIQ
jgi:hypothetical protein